MKYYINTLFGILLFALASCCHGESTSLEKYANKLDARSQNELIKNEKEDSNKLLSLVIMIDNEKTDEIIKDIKKLNITPQAQAGNIITAKTDAKTVRSLLKLDGIKKIEINKTSSIKKS